MRTIVYVDGYNLYYGLLRRSPYKWLDLFSLFQNNVLLSSTEVLEVRYYTAPVKGAMSDDPESPIRQRIYLQALKKMPPHKVKIIEGSMMSSTPYQRLVDKIPAAPELESVKVHNFTEKKTDVNLATDMLSDAWRGRCDQVVLCSNDTDFEGALTSIRSHLPSIRVGLVAPIPGNDHRKINNDLKNKAHWSKLLSTVHLQSAQLPPIIQTGKKPIMKPDNW
jgi:6-hydroxy-3-succinoylpyridine 3-monooxygenase